ncbi:hypothetical protein FQZ97_1091550 [compost metagenome]
MRFVQADCLALDQRVAHLLEAIARHAFGFATFPPISSQDVYWVISPALTGEAVGNLSLHLRQDGERLLLIFAQP